MTLMEYLIKYGTPSLYRLREAIGGDHSHAVRIRSSRIMAETPVMCLPLGLHIMVVN